MVLTVEGTNTVFTVLLILLSQKASAIIAITFLPPKVSGITYLPSAEAFLTPVMTTQFSRFVLTEKSSPYLASRYKYVTVVCSGLGTGEVLSLDASLLELSLSGLSSSGLLLPGLLLPLEELLDELDEGFLPEEVLVLEFSGVDEGSLISLSECVELPVEVPAVSLGKSFLGTKNITVKIRASTKTAAMIISHRLFFSFETSIVCFSSNEVMQ